MDGNERRNIFFNYSKVFNSLAEKLSKCKCKLIFLRKKVLRFSISIFYLVEKGKNSKKALASKLLKPATTRRMVSTSNIN